MAVKDPTIVEHAGRQHLFYTAYDETPRLTTGYVQAPSLSGLNDAERLDMRTLWGDWDETYFAAPQVFFDEILGTWCLLAQVQHHGAMPPLLPVVSFNREITDPAGWSIPVPVALDLSRWFAVMIDFWIICDAAEAYLFFTDQRANVWRMTAPRRWHPAGFSDPQLVVHSETHSWRLIEAAHVYFNQARDNYIMIVEAGRVTRQVDGRFLDRFMMAYEADSLAGDWRLIDPFWACSDRVQWQAPARQVPFQVSHPEFIRSAPSATLPITAPNALVIQRLLDEPAPGHYSQLKWHLRLLEHDNSTT